MGLAAGERYLVFYADDSRILGQDHEVVQDLLMMPVAMFCRMGLEANLENTKSIVCTPGLIWVGVGETACKRRAMVEGANFR